MREAPAPVVEIVSVGAEETTELSVVGKFPTAVPFGFTPVGGELAGAFVVDETTDASSVGKFPIAGAALADADGDGEADAAAIGDGSGDSPIAPLSCFN